MNVIGGYNKYEDLCGKQLLRKLKPDWSHCKFDVTHALKFFWEQLWRDSRQLVTFVLLHHFRILHSRQRCHGFQLYYKAESRRVILISASSTE